MRKHWQKNGLQSALLAVVLAATAAQAERDTFGLGTGRNGTLTVGASGTVVNAYTQVTAPLAPGDTSITTSGTTVGTGTFAAEDLVMVLQTTGIVPEPNSGDQTAIDLTNKPVGRWEFARLASVSGDTLTLTAPLIHSYTASVTQVIRVPEYTTVSIASGRSIVARPWDGSTGGIVAFLATGTVTNNNAAGGINATGAGFRGGLPVDDASERTGCIDLDEPAAAGAQRGEGIAVTRYGATHTGRGNVANAGGGGVCVKAGGGGGGHVGAGGIGGRSAFSDGQRVQARGLPGAALSLSTQDAVIGHLLMGGGGGAGHATDGTALEGGRGGGIVFIRAAQLAGTGAIAARGGAPASAESDGGSGGGAGGSIYLRLQSTIACGSLAASGGNGGGVNSARFGPGGGGGGGRLFVQSTNGPPPTCTVGVLGASPGNQQDPGAPDGSPYGARAGDPGIVTLINSGFIQPTVAITTPANGSRTSNRRPTITGTATPNSTVSLLLNGTEVGQVTADASGNYSFIPSSDLADNTYVIRARADFQGVSSPEATSTFIVDITPPDTQIDSGPSGPTNSTDATFTFSSPDSDVAHYECSRDGTNYTTCTSPISYTGLAEGSYAFYVRAVDSAGNVDPSPEMRTWTVDLTLPDTRIDSNPPALTNSTSATFNFSSPSTDTDVARYECRLDGAAFTTCTSPITYTGLADGSHTFRVKAIDTAGNEDPTPASYTWEVDSTPPPAPVVTTPANGSRTTDTTPRISGTAEPDSTVTVYVNNIPVRVLTADGSGNWSFDSAELIEGEYRVRATATDAANNTSVNSNTHTFFVDLTAPTTTIVSGPPSVSGSSNATFDFSSNESPVTYECSLDGGAFAPCTDPVTFSGLVEGSHTLQVRAVDGAGNRDSTPESYTWTVDLNPPETTIVSGPPTPTSSTQATFDFSSNESPVTYQCSLDGAAFAPCSSSVTFTGLTEREYTLRVRAVDAAGNVDPTPASYTWTVDLTPPAAPVVTAPGNGSLLRTPRPTYSGTAVAGSVVTVIVDGVPVGTTVADASGNWNLPAPVDLMDGSYTVRARATDAAGNTSVDSNTNTFMLDATPPDTSISSTTPAVTNLREATFDFSSNESPVTYQCSLSGAAFAPCTDPVTLTELMDGTYTLQVRAVDAAGNADPTPAEYRWTVDTQAPDTTIASGPPSVTNATSATFNFESNESPVTYECSLDGGAYAPCLDPVTFSGLAEGNHTLSVRAVDAAGNVDLSPATWAWRVDLTFPSVPVILTPPEGALINNPRPVISGTADPNNTVRIYLNDELVGTVTSDAAGNWTFTPTTDLEGNYTLEATATNSLGNTSATAVSNFFVDLTPPETRIVYGPPERTESTSAEFNFNSEELATFECSLDGAAFTPCEETTTYTNLALGTHTLRVRAKDRAGNLDPTPAEYTWTITAPPDTTPPETTIVSGPPAETESTEATFNFSSNESPVTYECSLDGGAFVACANPITFQGLSEGQHTLAVRAVDAAGNRDQSPATYTWTVQRPVEPEPKDTAFLGDGLGCSATPSHGSNPALALLGLLMLVALGSRRR